MHKKEELLVCRCCTSSRLNNTSLYFLIIRAVTPLFKMFSEITNKKEIETTISFKILFLNVPLNCICTSFSVNIVVFIAFQCCIATKSYHKGTA